MGRGNVSGTPLAGTCNACITHVRGERGQVTPQYSALPWLMTWFMARTVSSIGVCWSAIACIYQDAMLLTQSRIPTGTVAEEQIDVGELQSLQRCVDALQDVLAGQARGVGTAFHACVPAL